MTVFCATAEGYPLQAAAAQPGRDQAEGAAVRRKSGGGEVESVAASGAADETSPAQPPVFGDNDGER